MRLRNKHKLADKWESTLYKVLKQIGDLPVYKVQPIDGDGPVRTLHRDLLLSCGDLVEPEDVEADKPKVKRPRTRRSPPQHFGETSDSEDDFPVYPIQPHVIQEERVVQVFDVPKPQHTTVTQVKPSRLQLQGVPTADETLPVKPAEMLPVVPEAEEPPNMNSEPTEVDIPPPDVTGEPSTERDLLDERNESPAEAADKKDASPEIKKIPGKETDMEVSHVTDKNKENTHPDPDPRPESDHMTHEETSDIRHRPERSRRPPGRFHYPELGKPLISFAKSLLESFSQTLETINYYDISPHSVF